MSFKDPEGYVSDDDSDRLKESCGVIVSQAKGTGRRFSANINPGPYPEPDPDPEPESNLVPLPGSLSVSSSAVLHSKCNRCGRRLDSGGGSEDDSGGFEGRSEMDGEGCVCCGIQDPRSTGSLSLGEGHSNETISQKNIMEDTIDGKNVQRGVTTPKRIKSESHLSSPFSGKELLDNDKLLPNVRDTSTHLDSMPKNNPGIMLRKQRSEGGESWTKSEVEEEINLEKNGERKVSGRINVIKLKRGISKVGTFVIDEFRKKSQSFKKQESMTAEVLGTLLPVIAIVTATASDALSPFLDFL